LEKFKIGLKILKMREKPEESPGIAIERPSIDCFVGRWLAKGGLALPPRNDSISGAG
jgi:hypothetical protein